MRFANDATAYSVLTSAAAPGTNGEIVVTIVRAAAAAAENVEADDDKDEAAEAVLPSTSAVVDVEAAALPREAGDETDVAATTTTGKAPQALFHPVIDDTVSALRAAVTDDECFNAIVAATRVLDDDAAATSASSAEWQRAVGALSDALSAAGYANEEAAGASALADLEAMRETAAAEP